MVPSVSVDVFRHFEHRCEYVVIVAPPIALGLHQIYENFVGSLQGHVSRGVGEVSMWTHPVNALIVLPTVVSLMVHLLTPHSAERRRFLPFVALRGDVSTILLEAVDRSPEGSIGDPSHWRHDWTTSRDHHRSLYRGHERARPGFKILIDEVVRRGQCRRRCYAGAVVRQRIHVVMVLLRRGGQRSDRATLTHGTTRLDPRSMKASRANWYLLMS